MSDAARIAASYKRALDRVGETLAVRRYSGDGHAPAHVDTPVRGRVTEYQANELIGSIVQGDRKVICLVDTINSVLPLTVADKIIVRGEELSIRSVDDNTRRVNGVLIALEIQVSG